MNIDKIINTFFSFGAAVVVFGAWAKLEHKEFSDTALTIGMLSEATIFCIYGLLEWRKQSKQKKQEMPLQGEMNVDELTTTMKQTNRILNKVFRAD